MEQNLRDKYPKAKIEEPNLRLPKAMLKPDIDSSDDLCYMLIFEDDTRRAQHLAEAIAAGAKLDRRVYRIRNKEIVKFVEKDFRGMSKVHRASKATIGLLSDHGCNLHSHGYIDLLGTVEEVSTAEGLILDNILKTYSTLAYPVILMPPTIYWDYIKIPVQKICRVLGTYGTNILRMEMESGAWIKIEQGAPPGGSEQEKLINVFGPRQNVTKAITLIKAVTYEPTEPSVAQEDLWREFNEPSWQEFFEREEAEEAKLKEYSREPEKVKQQAVEGGSGGPEIEKQEDVKTSGDGESKSKEAENESEKKKKPKEKQEEDVHEEDEDEKGKQQAEEGGSGQPEIEKQEEDVKVADSDGKKTSDGESRSKEAEGESEKKKNPKKRKKKSEGSKQIEKGEEKDSGESEKGKLAEDGGSVETEKENQPVHVEEADSAKTEDEKEGDKSKDKRQEEDVEEAESEKEKGVKKVERILDKYPKAKIEEPNLRLPKVLLKPNIEVNEDLCYLKIFDEDTRRAQHLAEAIAAGAKLDRRVYRMRIRDLVKFTGKNGEAMRDIHRASKATIGMLTDAESNHHGHGYIDLLGTIEEVSIAEELILDSTLKMYSTLAYPVILMPPTIYEDYIVLPFHKVMRVLGPNKINILRMEMESGAWIAIEQGAPPGGSESERSIRVFGPREHVIKAIRLIRAVTYEPTEPSAAQQELLREFNDPCWRDFFERKEEEEAKLKEFSGELEKEKQQADEGGSGVTEKESQQVDVKQAKEAEGESEKKNPNELIKPLEKKFSGEKLSEGLKQTEEGKEKESGESEKGRLAEDGDFGVIHGERDLEKKSEKLNKPLKKKSSDEKLSEGSKETEDKSEEKTKQQEFKEPSWSQTFGGDKQTEEAKDKESGELQAEEGGSGVTEKEKQEEDVHEEDEDEKGGDELKDKRQEDDKEADSEKEKGGKTMEQKPRDKYPKAKIEQPNLHLPKALLKPDGDPTDDLAYMKIFDEDIRRAQHLAEAIAAGAKLDRRVYRIRNKELVKFIGKDFEGMIDVHRASKATIGILADAQSNCHSHSYIDLVGTVEEVSTAEGLILDNILTTYSTLAYPVILMPPTIYGNHIIIPVQKVVHVLGTYGVNLLRMEMESGAWIKIEPGAPPGRSEKDRLINVFGPREHVIKAIELIGALTSEPVEASEELWREFKEPSWREFFAREAAEAAKLKEHSGELSEKGKQQQQQAEFKEGSQSQTFVRKKPPSKGTEEERFKEPSWSLAFGHVNLEGDKDDEESGELLQEAEEEGGSGVTEKEKQDPEEDVVHEEDENEKEKQQPQQEQVDGKEAEEGESEKGKPMKLILRLKKKSEGSKQTEEGKEKESGDESEKGKLKKLITRLKMKSSQESAV